MISLTPGVQDNPVIKTGCLIACCAVIFHQPNKKAVLANIDDITAIKGSMPALLDQFDCGLDNLKIHVIAATKVLGEDEHAQGIREKNIASVREALKFYGLSNVEYQTLPENYMPVAVSFALRSGELKLSNSWQYISRDPDSETELPYLCALEGQKTFLVPKTPVLDCSGNLVRSEPMLNAEQEVTPVLKKFFEDHKTHFFKIKKALAVNEKTGNKAQTSHADNVLKNREGIRKER